MALSNEDKKDISSSLGKRMANKIDRVTSDARNKAIHARLSNKARGGNKTGKPIVLRKGTDRATGLHNTRLLLD